MMQQLLFHNRLQLREISMSVYSLRYQVIKQTHGQPHC